MCEVFGSAAFSFWICGHMHVVTHNIARDLGPWGKQIDCGEWSCDKQKVFPIMKAQKKDP